MFCLLLLVGSVIFVIVESVLVELFFHSYKGDAKQAIRRSFAELAASTLIFGWAIMLILL